MISYQKLFDKLKEEGWSFYRVRQEKLIGQGTLTRLRNQSGGLDSKTLDKICRTFNCQPGDLMEYIPDEVTESDSE